MGFFHRNDIGLRLLLQLLSLGGTSAVIQFHREIYTEVDITSGRQRVLVRFRVVLYWKQPNYLEMVQPYHSHLVNVDINLLLTAYQCMLVLIIIRNERNDFMAKTNQGIDKVKPSWNNSGGGCPTIKRNFQNSRLSSLIYYYYC